MGRGEVSWMLSYDIALWHVHTIVGYIARSVDSTVHARGTKSKVAV